MNLKTPEVLKDKLFRDAEKLFSSPADKACREEHTQNDNNKKSNPKSMLPAFFEGK